MEALKIGGIAYPQQLAIWELATQKSVSSHSPLAMKNTYEHSKCWSRPAKDNDKLAYVIRPGVQVSKVIITVQRASDCKNLILQAWICLIWISKHYLAFDDLLIAVTL